jgi:hypothetical protein
MADPTFISYQDVDKSARKFKIDYLNGSTLLNTDLSLCPDFGVAEGSKYQGYDLLNQ